MTSKYSQALLTSINNLSKVLIEIAVSLTLILKTIRLPYKPVLRRNDYNDIVLRFSSNIEEPAKKSEKLKSQKLSKG